MKLRLAFVLAFLLALVPGTAFAQESSDGMLIAVSRNLALDKGDVAEGVVIVDGDGRIDGTVTDFVLLIHGDLTIAGEVQGSVTVINGKLTLLDGSRVEDVSLADSTLDRASGATVTGSIDEKADFAFKGVGVVLSIYFWITVSIALLAGALVFAAIGGSQLVRATTAMTTDASQVIVAGVALWVGLPILAFVVFITVIGIPLGIALFFVLPAMWILGYIVAGTRLGIWLAGMTGRSSGEHPYLSAVVGVLLLQLVSLVPVLGWLAASIAGFWGGAALALIAWRAIRPQSNTSDLPPVAPAASV